MLFASQCSAHSLHSHILGVILISRSCRRHIFSVDCSRTDLCFSNWSEANPILLPQTSAVGQPSDSLAQQAWMYWETPMSFVLPGCEFIRSPIDLRQFYGTDSEFGHHFAHSLNLALRTWLPTEVIGNRMTKRRDEAAISFRLSRHTVFSTFTCTRNSSNSSSLLHFTHQKWRTITLHSIYTNTAFPSFPLFVSRSKIFRSVCCPVASHFPESNPVSIQKSIFINWFLRKATQPEKRLLDLNLAYRKQFATAAFNRTWDILRSGETWLPHLRPMNKRCHGKFHTACPNNLEQHFVHSEVRCSWQPQKQRNNPGCLCSCLWIRQN